MSLVDEIKKLKIELYREPRDKVDKYRLFYNENLFLPEEYYQKLLEGADIKSEDFRYYRDSYNEHIESILSDFLKIDKNMLIVGNGVDYLIILTMGLIAKLKKKVDIVVPAFDVYAEQASMREIPIREILLNPDFSIDPDKIIRNSSDSFLFLCSPNNPTGRQFELEKIKYLIENYKGIVVLDETYGEFADYTLIYNIDDYENLIVLRSFSKAWGLAGLRAGYAVSSPELIRSLKTFMDPYPTPLVVKKILASALQLYNYVEKAVKETITMREKIFKALKSIPTITPYPSQTNFIFFRTIYARQLFKKLEERSIYIKDVSKKPLCENGLRVTVAPENISNLFLESVREIIGELSERSSS